MDAEAGASGTGTTGRFGRVVSALRAGVRRWPLVAVALVVVVGLLVGVATSVGVRRDLDDERAHATELAAEIDGLRAGTAKLEDERSELEIEIERLEARIPMPDLTGMSLRDAEQAIEDAGWQHGRVDAAPDPRSVGSVVGQDPAPGTRMRHGAVVHLTTAVAPPETWQTIVEFTGTGGLETPPFDLPAAAPGKLKLVYDFGGSGNSAITLYQAPEVYIDLLLNEIGAVAGETFLYVDGSGFYFDVLAGGPWTIHVQQLK